MSADAQRTARAHATLFAQIAEVIDWSRVAEVSIDCGSEWVRVASAYARKGWLLFRQLDDDGAWIWQHWYYGRERGSGYVGLAVNAGTFGKVLARAGIPVVESAEARP